MPNNDVIVEEYFASFGVKGLNQTIAKLKEFQKQAQITFDKLSVSEDSAIESTTGLNESLSSLNATMGIVSRSLTTVTAKTSAFSRTNKSAMSGIRGAVRGSATVGRTFSQAMGIAPTPRVRTFSQAMGIAPTPREPTPPKGPMLTTSRVFGAFLGFEGAKKIFDVNTQYQNVVNGIMNVTHSASKAQVVMNQLQQAALRMHFNFLDLAKDFPRFALSISGAGGSMQDSLRMFQNMTIAIAGAHLQPWMAQRTMQDFINDIVNTPKVSGRLIRTEFGLSGFAGVLMKSLNIKSTYGLIAKLNSLNPAARAQLVSSTLARAFRPGFTAFGRTPQAALNDLRTTFQTLLVGFGRSGGLQAMVQAFKSVNEILQVMRPLIVIIGIAFGVMAKAISFVNNALDDIKDLFPKDSEWGKWISFVTKLGISLLVLSRSTKMVSIAMGALELVTSPVLATILAITAAVTLLIVGLHKLYSMTSKERHDAGQKMFFGGGGLFSSAADRTGAHVASPHGFSLLHGFGGSAASMMSHHTLNVHVNAGSNSGHEIADHVVRQVKAHYTNKGILQ